MPPKILRTPAKKEEVDDGEDLETLVYLRDEKLLKLVRLKQKLAGLGLHERTVTQINVNQRVLDASNAEFNSLHERIVRLDAKKRKEHGDKLVEFETLFIEIDTMLEGWKQTLEIPAGPATAPAPAAQRPVVIQQSLPRLVPTFD